MALVQIAPVQTVGSQVLRLLLRVGITAVVATFDGYTHRQFLRGAFFGCSSRPVDSGNLLGATVLIIFVYIYRASCPSS
jgi:hypothetical protein